MKFQLLLYCTLFYVNIGLCLLTTYLDMLFSRVRGEAPGLGALARCAPSVLSHHGWETELLVGCGGCGVWGRQQGHTEPLPALVQALPHHRARPEPGGCLLREPQRKRRQSWEAAQPEVSVAQRGALSPTQARVRRGTARLGRDRPPSRADPFTPGSSDPIHAFPVVVL